MSDTDVIIALIVAAGFLVALLPLVSLALRRVRARRVEREGTDATARILDLRDTGNRYNDMPELAIRLEVHPPQGGPFEAELRRFVGLAEIDRFARGNMLSVRFDPARPQHVVLPA